MTKRADIIDGRFSGNAKYGLIYTCKCGWIDLGHANPEGASKLWETILNENGEKSRDGKGYKVTYSQSMRWKFLSSTVSQPYYVKSGLSLQEKESVALAIFMEISIKFEENQRFLRPDSSFSNEDLISNLIGFYRAVKPGKDYISFAEPVSKEAALKVWDTHGAVGKNKNKNFSVQLFPCEDCKLHSPAYIPPPAWLNTITPAKKGNLFKDWETLFDKKFDFNPF